MASKVSEELRNARVGRESKLTPEERLRAHASHCESMIKLHRAGEEMRRHEIARRGGQVCEPTTVEYRSPGESDPVRGVIEVADRHGNSADLLLGITGMSPDAFQRGKRVEFEDGELPVVGIEDAEIAYQVNRGILDEAMLSDVAKGFGAETLHGLEALRRGKS